MSGLRQGALWICGGMAVIALSDNLLAAVADRIGLWQLQILRSAMVLPIALGFAAAIGALARVRPDDPRRVAERTAMHVLALFAYFAALPVVGIAQAAAGLFTSPIWVALLGALFFGERLGPVRVLAVLLGFAGVCIVMGVGAQPLRPMSLVAVSGGLFYGLGVIWTRRHCAGESAVGLAIWMFVGFLCMGLVALAGLPLLQSWLEGTEGTGFLTMAWQPLDAPMAGAVLLIGLGGIIATGCLARGYQSGPPSIMALFDFSFLIWAPGFGWLLRGEAVSATMAAGMALIMLAGGLAVWSAERRAARV